MRILRTSRNAADCLFSRIPKGLRIGCFFSSDMAFTFRCKRWATTCLRAARYKYLRILKRKIWVEKSGIPVPPPKSLYAVTCFEIMSVQCSKKLRTQRKHHVTRQN